MRRIQKTFTQLHQKQKKALIPFITAGDPQPDVSVKLMHTLVAAGANLIELGVPFSDPMADGPVIQAASERALSHHMTLDKVLQMVKAFRQQDSQTPVILMGYLNPIEIMGYASFAQKAQDAGVDGVLTVDLPPEEAHAFTQHLDQHALDPIFLLAPTSTEARIIQTVNMCRGFLYYVSLKGITGAQHLDLDDIQHHLTTIQQHSTLPIAVGFGIHDAQSAQNVARLADAIVIGSALVKKLAAEEKHDKLYAVAETFIKDIRAAIDKI